MASLNMAKKTLLNYLNIIMTIFCIACCNTHSSLASSSQQSLPNHNNNIRQLSTIAAEPSVLPYTPSSPLSSPTTSYALSPDISPLFPTTPKSSSNAPSSDSSSLPIIPSSPSPPNPDDSLSAPHPELSISPTGSIPESSAFRLSSSVLLNFAMVVTIAFFCMVILC